MKTTQRFGKGVATGALLSASVLTMGQAFAQGPWSFSANIGAVSNYLWRGVTQTGDQAAIQGGIDVGHESGFYAGTWVSNIDWDEGSTEEVIVSPVLDDMGDPVFDDNGLPTYTAETVGADPSSPNYELDVYMGFGGAINDDLSYDLSAIYYAYPDGRYADFAEIGASATYRWITAGLAYTVWGEAEDAPGVDEAPFSEGDLYYYGSVDVGLPYDFGASVFGGYYDFDYDAGGLDYGHWGVSVSREAGDFGTFSLNYEQVGRDTYDDDPKFWVGWLKEF